VSQSQCSHTPRSGFPHVSEPSIILRRYSGRLAWVGDSLMKHVMLYTLVASLPNCLVNSLCMLKGLVLLLCLRS
jgi:hypothetical protein